MILINIFRCSLRLFLMTYKKVLQEQKLEEIRKKIADVEIDLEISAS